MSEPLFEVPSEPPDPPDACAVDEVDVTVVDLASPVALDPDRLLPSGVAEALEEIDALRTLRASAEAREFALVGHVATIAPRPAQTSVTAPSSWSTSAATGARRCRSSSRWRSPRCCAPRTPPPAG